MVHTPVIIQMSQLEISEANAPRKIKMNPKKSPNWKGKTSSKPPFLLHFPRCTMSFHCKFLIRNWEFLGFFPTVWCHEKLKERKDNDLFDPFSGFWISLRGKVPLNKVFGGSCGSNLVFFGTFVIFLSQMKVFFGIAYKKWNNPGRHWHPGLGGRPKSFVWFISSKVSFFKFGGWKGECCASLGKSHNLWRF